MDSTPVRSHPASLRPGAAAPRPYLIRTPPRPSALQWLLDGPGEPFLRPLSDLLAAVLAALLLLGGLAATLSARGDDRALWLLPPVLLGLMGVRGLYRRRLRTLVLDSVVPVVGAVTFAVMAVVVADAYAFAPGHTADSPVRLWVTTLVLVGGGRLALALVQRVARSSGVVARPTLIVGAGHVGAQVARRLGAHAEYGLRPVGFLDAKRYGSVEAAGDLPVPVLGTFADLRAVVRRTHAQFVIFAFAAVKDDELLPLVRECDDLGLDVSLVPRMFESINDRAAYEPLGGLPMLGLRAVDPKGWQFAVKHAFDRVAAATMLLAIAPLMAGIALAVRLGSPGPVLFRQRRVGRDGREFDLLKFRSMVTEAPERPFAPAAGAAPGGVEGDDRRTRFGRSLRRTSLDELPQLVNVLRGEMSLVGPRPERPEFVELFGRDITRYGDRHRVRSGITGWAQVHGLRGQTSLTDRVESDNFYIQHWSLGLDVKVLALTVLAVLRSAE